MSFGTNKRAVIPFRSRFSQPPLLQSSTFTASDDFDIIFLYKAPLKKYVKEKCFIPKLYMKNAYPVNFQVFSGLTV